MRCEECNGSTFVTNTKRRVDALVRHRECKKCGATFSTVEIRKKLVEGRLNMQVLKASLRVEGSPGEPKIVLLKAKRKRGGVKVAHYLCSDLLKYMRANVFVPKGQYVVFAEFAGVCVSVLRKVIKGEGHIRHHIGVKIIEGCKRAEEYEKYASEIMAAKAVAKRNNRFSRTHAGVAGTEPEGIVKSVLGKKQDHDELLSKAIKEAGLDSNAFAD